MNTIDNATVEAKIRDGYNFDFGKYISDGFNIFVKEWLMFSLYGLVSLLIILFSAVTVVGILFVAMPTMLGFSIATEKVERGERLEFNDFFGAFKNLGNYAVLMLIIIGITILLYTPFLLFFIIIEAGKGSDGLAAVAGIFIMFYYLFIYVAMYALQASVIFAPYLIHYGNYSGLDAFKTSIKLFKKQPWWILLFVFVVGMISGIGYIACIIGVFASMAAGAIMNYAMVKDVLMNAEHSEIDQIGNQAYH